MRSEPFIRSWCRVTSTNHLRILARSRRGYASDKTKSVKQRISSLIVRGTTQQIVRDLDRAFTGFLPTNSPHTWPAHFALAPGYHFLYGNRLERDDYLLEDGTDKRHLPHPKFKFRIWAGGDIQYARQVEPLRLNVPGQRLALLEKTLDVKLKEDGARAFVKIRRTLVGVPPRNTEAGPALFDQITQADLEARDVKGHNVSLAVVEDRWLSFTKESPAVLMKLADSKIPPCPENGDFSWSLKPNSALLFRFSALTFNAHAIHIDREYAKNVYGLSDLIVHGPFTVFVMLQILSRGFCEHESRVGLVRGQVRIESISYTNMAPLYVDQEMKISCKKVQGEDNVDAHHIWDVWISKQIEGLWRVAVKASVKARVQSEEAARCQPEPHKAVRTAAEHAESIDANVSWSAAPSESAALRKAENKDGYRAPDNVDEVVEVDYDEEEAEPQSQIKGVPGAGSGRIPFGKD